MKTLITLLAFVLSTTYCMAQSNPESVLDKFYSENTEVYATRSTSTAFIPRKLLISTPKIASDCGIIEITSPEYEVFTLRIFIHLENHLVSERAIWLIPGQQKIPLHLYDFDEGEYTLAIYRGEEVIAYRYFEVVR